MENYHREQIRTKLPFLRKLVVADNDFSYIDENGNKVKVEPEEVIRQLRECKAELKEYKDRETKQ